MTILIYLGFTVIDIIGKEFISHYYTSPYFQPSYKWRPKPLYINVDKVKKTYTTEFNGLTNLASKYWGGINRLYFFMWQAIVSAIVQFVEFYNWGNYLRNNDEFSKT